MISNAAQHARSTLSSIKSVADWFGGVRGRRKTMLLISEGIDYDITDIIRGYDAPSSSASSIIDDTREAIAAAARANVSIYAVDPRGLTTMGDDTIGVSSFADDPTAGIGIGSLNNELRLSQDSLRTLADETGGFAAVNTNQFTSAFQRIVSDNSTYYVLAYYPPSDKRNGKFHKIEVKTTRPGLTIRSRKGYSAPRGKAPARACCRRRKAVHRRHGGAEQSDSGQRRPHADVRGAVQGHRPEGVGAHRRRDGRPGSQSGREQQGRGVLLRLRHAGKVACRIHRQPDDQPAAGNQGARRADRIPHAEPSRARAGPLSAAGRLSRHASAAPPARSPTISKSPTTARRHSR